MSDAIEELTRRVERLESHVFVLMHPEYQERQGQLTKGATPMGGKPKTSTPADKRLKQNKPKPAAQPPVKKG